MKANAGQRELSLTPGKMGWLLALLVAVLLHLAIAAVPVWSPSITEPREQVKAANTDGVEISLSPAGSAAGSPKKQQNEDVPEPVKVSELRSMEPEPEKKPPPRPDKPFEPVKKVEPVKKLKTEPQPELKPETFEVKEATPPPLASEEAGSTVKSGSTSVGGGLPSDTRDYAATLLTWLEQYREYPRYARLRRHQGTVMLYFEVDRQGKVLSYHIKQSSGHVALDEEVKNMIERAQPLPAMPETVHNHVLKLIVPVQFTLR